MESRKVGKKNRFKIEKLEERIAPAGIGHGFGHDSHGKPDSLPPTAPGADGAGLAHGAEQANCHASINADCPPA